jgi:type VI secretion system secreted protein Hcp
MAVDMFLYLDPIKGESKDKAHTDKIDILAWSWGMSQSGTTHMGGGGGSGKVSVQDLSFTHYIDSSTNDLINYCCQGKHIDTGKLIVRKAGGKQVEYIKIEFKEIIVTSVSFGGSGSEDRLTENFTLNFASFHFTYTDQLASGAPGSPHDAKWNIAKNDESA